jgi:hypothetical protein
VQLISGNAGKLTTVFDMTSAQELLKGSIITSKKKYSQKHMPSGLLHLKGEKDHEKLRKLMEK